MSDDLYDILGVARDASHDEIREAYRLRAKATHPDTGGSREAFQELSRAYRILSDPDKRAAYDEHGDEDDKPDNIEAAAMTVIESLLEQAVNDPAARQKDLVWVMRSMMTASLGEARAARDRLALQETRVGDLMRRFRTKRETDLVRMLLERRLRTVRIKIAAQELAIRAHERAVAIISDYEFEREDFPDLATMMRNAATR